MLTTTSVTFAGDNGRSSVMTDMRSPAYSYLTGFDTDLLKSIYSAVDARGVQALWCLISKENFVDV